MSAIRRPIFTIIGLALTFTICYLAGRNPATTVVLDSDLSLMAADHPPNRSYSHRVDEAIVRRQEALDYASGITFNYKGNIRDEEGNLDHQSLRSLGISDTHITAIEFSYKRSRQEIEDDFKSRIEVDHRRSDPEKLTQTFKVKSSPETADRILSQLRSDIVALVGENLGETVYQGITPAEQFGYFGRQEMHFKMYPSTDSEIGYEILINFYEPQFMISLGQRRIRSYKDLNLVFGTALDAGSEGP